MAKARPQVTQYLLKGKYVETTHGPIELPRYAKECPKRMNPEDTFNSEKGKWVTGEKKISKEDVNDERSRRLSEGKSFKAGTYPIEIKMNQDQIPLIPIWSETMKSRISVKDKTKFIYRDDENKDHHLNAAQSFDLFKSVLEWFQDIHEMSWKLKKMRPIPTNFKDDEFWSKVKLNVVK